MPKQKHNDTGKILQQLPWADLVGLRAARLVWQSFPPRKGRNMDAKPFWPVGTRKRQTLTYPKKLRDNYKK